MGPRIAACIALKATLLTIGLAPAHAAVKERQLVDAGAMKAFVEDAPDWCGPRVDVAVRSGQSELFRGERIQLQRMLAMVRGALLVECPDTVSIRLTGLVDDVFVFGGEASRDANWILVEVPALLTQPYIDEASIPSDDEVSGEADAGVSPTPAAQAPSSQSATPLEAATSEISRCDALAAHPDDPERPDEVRGVTDDELNTDRAAAVCRQALAAEPDDPRIKFQLARALLFSGQAEEAIELLIAAAEDGHGASLAYLGEITLYGAAGLESDPETARNLYSRAADAGFEPARQLAADIVGGVTPDQDPEEVPAAEAVGVTYAYPAMVKAFTAGKQPQGGMKYGHKVYYAASALGGIRYECPALVSDDRDWESAAMSALLRMGIRGMIELGAEYESGRLDGLMQGGMDDGYAVALSNGCNAKATKNFVRAATSCFDGEQ